jgi:hypothetical protein
MREIAGGPQNAGGAQCRVIKKRNVILQEIPPSGAWQTSGCFLLRGALGCGA